MNDASMPLHLVEVEALSLAARDGAMVGAGVGASARAGVGASTQRVGHKTPTRLDEKSKL